MSRLRGRALNGWSFFFLVAALTLAAILIGLTTIGFATPEAAVEMIRLSVQLASPWVFLAFIASPLNQLAPSEFANWLLRNRRYLGLSFAAGFGWQAAFIGVMLARHNTYYWEELHNDHDLFLRMISYVFLTAMTVTSFFPVRRRMRREHWRYLHLAGIWYFWAAIWVSYAGQAASAGARTIDLIYTTLGLLALSLRLVAYQRTRSRGLVSP